MGCLLCTNDIDSLFYTLLWWAQPCVVKAREGETAKTDCLDPLYPYTIVRRISIHIFPTLIPHFWDFLSNKDAKVWIKQLEYRTVRLAV